MISVNGNNSVIIQTIQTVRMLQNHQNSTNGYTRTNNARWIWILLIILYDYYSITEICVMLIICIHIRDVNWNYVLK